MRIDTEQLAQHLTRGLKPLYAVHGEETLLALEAADRIRLRCRQEGYSEREVLTVESGFDWSRLAMSGNSLSLFSTKRLLELRIPSGKPGNEGAEALRSYAANLAPDTVTLISLPKLERTQLSSGWFEALESAGVVVAANPIPLARLPQWLAARLALQEQQADEQTLELLVGRVEGNLLAAHQEVQKLALLFPPGKLDAEQVRNVVLDVARYDVFKLGETLLAADTARFVRMLDGLRGEGVAAPLVLVGDRRRSACAAAHPERPCRRTAVAAVDARGPGLGRTRRSGPEGGAPIHVEPARGRADARRSNRPHDQRSGAGRRVG